MSVALKCLLLAIACSICSTETPCSSGYSDKTSSIMDVFSKQNSCCITKMALFDCSIIWKLFASIDYDIPCESCGGGSEATSETTSDTPSETPSETLSETPSETPSHTPTGILGEIPNEEPAEQVEPFPELPDVVFPDD